MSSADKRFVGFSQQDNNNNKKKTVMCSLKSKFI